MSLWIDAGGVGTEHGDYGGKSERLRHLILFSPLSFRLLSLALVHLPTGLFRKPYGSMREPVYISGGTLDRDTIPAFPAPYYPHLFK